MTRRFTRIGAELTGDERPFRAMLNRSDKALTTTLGKWKGQLSGFNGVFAGLLGTAGIGVAVRELDRLGESAIRYGDSIGKAARTAGIGADALQEYREAAELTGTTQEQLDAALGRFTRRLGEARRGNKAYADAFGELGVTMRDTNEQALEKTFRTLEGIDDITIRTSLATKVFGDDARRMALIVGDSAGALDRMREAARAGGRVLNADLVEAAENAQDRISILNRTLDVELNATVLKNIDGFVQWRQLLNDIQIAFINITSSLGEFVGMYRRFLGLRASDDIRDLRIRYADLGLEIDKTRQRLENLQNLRPSRFDKVNEANLRNIKREQETLRRLTEERAALLEEINALEASANDTPAGADINTLAGGSGLGSSAGALNPAAGRSSERSTTTPFTTTRVSDEIEELTAATDKWRLASEFAGRSIAEAFSQAIIFGDSLGQSLKRLAAQLASRALTNLLFSFLPGGGGAGGGLLGRIFGGARASGGPVSPGRAYLVGEQGPEMFMPNTAGNIIPNGAAIAGGVTVMITNRFDVGLEAVDQRIAQTTPVVTAAVVEGIQKAQRRPNYA